MKKMIIAGAPDVLLKVLSEYQKANKSTIEIWAVPTRAKLLEAVSKDQFDLVIINVLMEKVSAYKLIQKLKEIPNFSTKILLFSYFFKIDQADNSAMHGFYLRYVKEDFAQDPNPPHYIGAFSNSMMDTLFIKAFEQFLK